MPASPEASGVLVLVSSSSSTAGRAHRRVVGKSSGSMRQSVMGAMTASCRRAAPSSQPYSAALRAWSAALGLNRVPVVGVHSAVPTVDATGRARRRDTSIAALARGYRSEQGAQDVLHDAAVPVVALLAGRVDADGDGESLVVGLHGELAGHVSATGDPDDLEDLLAGQAERRGGVAAGYCSGRTPIPIRLDRWMRS